MRILLVAPPWLDVYGHFKEAAKLGCISPQLGLTYLGSSILAVGSECRIVDMQLEGINAHGLIEVVKEYRPNMIGITATTPIIDNARFLAKEIKKTFPEIPIGLGGVHSTVVGRSAIEECEYFNFQVVGEGEFAIQEIIASYQAGKSLKDIDGVIFRDGDKIIENKRRALVKDLDSIPMPARHMLKTQLYKHYLPQKGYITYANIFTSRGCPFHCTFCSQHTMYGRKVRWHSVDRVIAELKEITEGLGIKHVIIMDETMTLKKDRTLEICQAIKNEGLAFTWEGWTHASTIDEETLIAMKEAGLIRLSFGIESGDPEILKSIKKGVTLEQIRNAYKMAEKVGIETRGSAILGHPYETRETAWRTIKFTRSIKECQQIFLNVACPYPGTELYDYAINEKGGMKLLTNDYSKYKRYGTPVISVNDLGSKDLQRMQSIGLLLFYLTPRRILYNLFQRTGFKSGVVNAFAFARSVLNGLFKKSK